MWIDVNNIDSVVCTFVSNAINVTFCRFLSAMNSHMKFKMSLKYYFTIKPTVNFLASIKQSDVLVDEGSDGLISLSSS